MTTSPQNSKQPQPSTLDAALAYAKLGWHVFPITPGAKAPPLTVHGSKDASTDPEQIQAWWRDQPSANIGVATGRVSGISVLDWDEKPHEGKFGESQTLSALIERHGTLPKTAVQRTWSGGGQALFAYHPDAPNAAGCYGRWLDGRNDGGYIVVPPSRVEDGARTGTYWWGASPFDRTLAPMPHWLLAAAQAVKPAARGGVKPKRSTAEWLQLLGGVDEGRRQDTLVKVVGKLYRDSPDLARELAHAWNEGRCNPPLPAEDVDACCDRIEAREAMRAPARAAEFVPLSSVAMRQVPWLWPGYLPRGAVTLLVGDPDKGKTLSALDIAARVSAGKPWPDGGANTLGGSDVLVLSAEDSPAYTIRPRIEAAGGDTDRIRVVSIEGAGLSLVRDLDRLEAALAQTGATLIVIDPLASYLPGIDENRNNEVRSTLAPFVTLAERQGVAVIGVVHMSKNVERNALQRVLGSTAFTALARAVFMVSQDPDDDSRRLFLPVKFNLGKRPAGLAFRPEGAEITTPEGLTLKTVRAAWEPGRVDAHPDEILRQLASGRAGAREIEASLRQALADGPLLLTELAQRLGKPERSLRRYRERLGIESLRDPADPMAGPYYCLPPGWSHQDRAVWVQGRMALRAWGGRQA